MIESLTAELLELRGSSLGRSHATFAVQWDCCSCSCCCCVPLPWCAI